MLLDVAAAGELNTNVLCGCFGEAVLWHMGTNDDAQRTTGEVLPLSRARLLASYFPALRVRPARRTGQHT